MKKFLYFVFLFAAGVSLIAASKLAWPIYKYSFVSGKSFAWYQNYFILSGSNLYSSSVLEHPEIKKIFTYSESPKVIRHFPFTDADAVLSFEAKKKKISLLVLSKSYQIVHTENFQTQKNVLDMDLQFDLEKKPVFLYLSRENDNNFLDIKHEGKNVNILTVSDPVIAFGLNWNIQSVHFIYQTKGNFRWVIWENGLYNHINLPFSVKAATFVPQGKETFCYLLDSQNSLWVLKHSGETYGRKKLLTDGNLQFTDSIIMMRDTSSSRLFLSSRTSTSVYEVELLSMESSKKPVLISLPFNTVSHPGLDAAGRRQFILESSLGHLYAYNPTLEVYPITQFNWSVDESEGYPELVFQWRKVPQSENFEYRYILDQNPNGKPLPDYVALDNEMVKLKSVKEGSYVFHIQGRSLKTGMETPVYHIPVIWKKPDLPSIVVVGENPDKTITGDPLEIFIKNYGPYEYYLEINAIPVFIPEKKFNSNRGQGFIQHRLKPGKYYIHIRAKDLQTNQFGPTLHYPVFLESLPFEQNVGAKEFKSDQEELDYIMKRLESSSGSPAERERWRKRLKELRQKMQDEIEDSI